MPPFKYGEEAIKDPPLLFGGNHFRLCDQQFIFTNGLAEVTQLFCKGKIIPIFSFAEHGLYVATTELCHCSSLAAIDNE